MGKQLAKHVVNRSHKQPRAFLKLLAALCIVATQTASAEVVEPTPFERELLRYRSYFDYGGFEPELQSLLPSGYQSRWRLRAGIDGEYSDNVDQDAKRRDALASNGSLGVGWFRQSPRLKGSAEYRFSSALYQSKAIEGRNGTTHALAGVAEWQAAQHLSFDAGGHITQNLIQGISNPLTGVRSSYANRSDEYSAHAGYSWRLSRTTTNHSDYAFGYRNYISDAAEGDDTRSHRAGTTFGWQATPKDNLSLGYRYGLDDDLRTSQRRQNHTGSATWGHTFLTFPGNRRSELTFSYTADRGLGSEGVDYWNHWGTVGYSLALSPRTNAGVHVGYQWIDPEEGSIEQGVIYGGNLSHQFSENTSGNISLGEAWSYEPPTSRSDFTELTRTRQVRGVLTTRFSRTVTGSVNGGYLIGDVSRSLSQTSSQDYWGASGGASISGRMGENGFWGLGYSAYRRQTQESEDDYLLQIGHLYYRHSLYDWLSGIIRYAHERRNYDAGSSFVDYHENRVSLGLTASW